MNFAHVIKLIQPGILFIFMRYHYICNNGTISITNLRQTQEKQAADTTNPRHDKIST